MPVKKYILNPGFWFILGVDVLLITAAHFLAYELRFETLFPKQLEMFQRSLAIVLPVKIIAFVTFHLYSGLWRFIGPRDVVKIILANIFSSLIIVAYIGMQYRFFLFSRSIILIDFILTVCFVIGFRLAIRAYYFPEQLKQIFRIRNLSAKNKKRLLIIGAGLGGERLLHTVFSNQSLNNHYEPIGFLDDDPGKKGRKMHGIPILGGVDSLPEVVAAHDVDEIMIAISRAKAQSMRRVLTFCEQTRVPFKIVPRMDEVVIAQGKGLPIREVSYEDLLGREPVDIDDKAVEENIADKIILVTGAGGSIGSELCSQICRYRPQLLMLLECSENNLYRVETGLKSRFPFIRLLPCLGSVEDYPAVEALMQRKTPHVIFHAAAYKHVPMMEMNPIHAVKNNVFGTLNMVLLSQAYGVKRFVFISTDKAVHPVSIMGVTKRVGELITQAQAQQGHASLISVRFGNVVGSDGSVAPLFMEQIRAGGPVTVTHADVTRFFMSIKEAVLLVLQAGSMGKGGETFILNMGEPIKILTMAEDLIHLAGKRPYDDIEITFTGLRPGEKLHEELRFGDEEVTLTGHSKILVIKATHVEWASLDDHLSILRDYAEKRNVTGVTEILKKIVPDYQPSEFLLKGKHLVESPRLHAIK